MQERMVFDPRDIRIMEEGLAVAENMLFVTFPNGISENVRKALAAAIVWSTTNGVRDVSALGARAVGTLNLKAPTAA